MVVGVVVGVTQYPQSVLVVPFVAQGPTAECDWQKPPQRFTTITTAEFPPLVRLKQWPQDWPTPEYDPVADLSLYWFGPPNANLEP